MDRNFYGRTKQAEVVSGSANFASLISAGAATYGLTPAQATSFAALDTALQSSYSAAITPETRTSVTIEEKNLAITNMRRNAVALSKIIYSTASVTDAMLIAVGLLPRTSPTPVPPTMVAPEVDAVEVDGRLVTVRVRQAGVDTKARPIGTVGAYIFSHVGPSAPTDPSAYKFEGLCTRQKVQVQFSNDVPSGATAWIAAAWVSQRGGQRGFACTPVSFTIQGGPILAEAA
ncbi:MAG: hypothetical protein WBD40_25720 [Tepidisphaeraceae bacterium]